MEAVILTGAPGAGKGTIASMLSGPGGFVHVSTGDMLREAVKGGTALGLEARAFMERGELVPDGLILRIVRERLAAGPRDARYLFDGFPRTLEQARALDALLAEFGTAVRAVFQLDVPRDVLVDRLSGRRVCRACGAVYHVRNIPTRVPGRCDRCGGETVQRPDDTEATVLNRLEVYRKQTATLIDYYRERGVLAEIPAAGDKDDTRRRIAARLAGAGA